MGWQDPYKIKNDITYCKDWTLFEQTSYNKTFEGQLRLPGGSDGKESTFNSGDLGSIPGLGMCPGEENGNPLQYSCLENPMHRGA